MKISTDRLKQIVFEEYLKEEGIISEHLSEDKADDLLAYIRGGKKPDWIDDDREIPDPPEVPATKKRPPADETMPMSRQSEPESIEDKIGALISGMNPEEVAALFQNVFEKIPGVETQDEAPPETLYSPGAEGRPQVGFKLEELKALIRKILSESV